MDNALRTLFRFKISLEERGWFASAVLEESLPKHHSISKWWIELFTEDKNLAMLVDLTSRHGFWLHSTRLASEMIPIKPEGQYFDTSTHLPVQLLDRILSRAERFDLSRGGEETALVVDVKTENDAYELKLALRTLQQQIRNYFKQIAGSSDPALRSMWQHSRRV